MHFIFRLLSIVLVLCGFSSSRLEAQSSPWAKPITIPTANNTDIGNPNKHSLAIDGEGNAITILDGFGFSLLTSAYLPFGKNSWEPVTVPPPSLQDIHPCLPTPGVISPPIEQRTSSVAINKKGASVATWIEGNFGDFTAVVAARLDLTTHRWTERIILNYDLGPSSKPGFQGNLFKPVVAIDSNGNAIVVWYNIAQSVLQAATLVNGIWGCFQNIFVNTTTTVPKYDIDVDANGNFMIVITDERKIQAASFGIDNFPSSINFKTIFQTSTNRIIDMDFSIALNGNAVAVWATTTDFDFDIQVSKFKSRWSDPIILAQGVKRNPTFGSAEVAAQVGVDKDGNAVVIWTDVINGTPALRYVAMPFEPFNNTPPLVPLTLTGSEGASFPKLVMDPDGNAVSIWVVPSNNERGGPVKVATKSAVTPSSWIIFELDTLGFFPIVKTNPFITTQAALALWSPEGIPAKSSTGTNLFKKPL